MKIFFLGKTVYETDKNAPAPACTKTQYSLHSGSNLGRYTICLQKPKTHCIQTCILPCTQNVYFPLQRQGLYESTACEDLQRNIQLKQ